MMLSETPSSSNNPWVYCSFLGAVTFSEPLTLETTLLSQGTNYPLQVLPMSINNQYESLLLSEIQLQLLNLSQSFTYIVNLLNLQ